MTAELSHTVEATVVRPVCDEQNGWRWTSEPL
jgi:hypothetical protein